MRSRSRWGQIFSERLAAGETAFQRCSKCEQLQYPPAELCRNCLSDDLSWQIESVHGEIIAAVAVHRSYAQDFADGAPWWIASVKLDAGPVCYAHVRGPLAGGTRVALVALIDRLGDGVLGALVDNEELAALQGRFS